MKEKNPKGSRLVASSLGLNISKYTWELWTNGYFQVLQMMDNFMLHVCTGFSGQLDKFIAFVL